MKIHVGDYIKFKECYITARTDISEILNSNLMLEITAIDNCDKCDLTEYCKSGICSIGFKNHESANNPALGLCLYEHRLNIEYFIIPGRKNKLKRILNETE